MRLRGLIPMLALVLAGPRLQAQAPEPDQAQLLAQEVQLLADTRIDGDYQAALKESARLLADQPDSPAVVVEYARVRAEVGEYAEALQACETFIKGRPDAPDVRLARARMLRELGRGAEALDETTRALELDPRSLQARFLQGQILFDRGERDRARNFFSSLADRADDIESLSGDDLVLVGRSCVYLAAAQRSPQLLKTVASQIYPTATRKDPRNLEALVASGELFASKYQYDHAGRDFQAALTINPNCVPALVGLADSRISQRLFAEAQENLEQALAVNPNSVPGLTLQALLDIYDEQTDEALEQLDRALAVNPNSIQTLALKAACYRQTSRPERYTEIEKQTLALNPHAGEFYHVVAGVLISRHQDVEAEELLLRAAELSPNDSGPATDLGLLYMRLGDAVRARHWLQLGWEMDTFNVLTYNTLNLLDRTASYRVIETDHFTIRIDPELDAVLAEYVPAFLEELHHELAPRFRYSPQRKTTVEFFPDHRYFSVRTTSIPFIGTVGACLGPVIALDSPRAMRPGAFNYLQVLRHEYTHAVNLNMTEGRIPHWLTEGFAVFCEQSPRPYEWRQLLFDAAAYDELIPIRRLSQGFTRSRTQARRQLAYAQSGLIVEYAVQAYGWDSLLTLVENFRLNLDTPRAVEQTFHVPLNRFESDFRQYVADMVSTWPLKPTPRVRNAPEVEARLTENPDDLDSRLELARIKLKRGDSTGALLEVRHVLEKQPRNTDALALQAAVRLRQRNRAEAERLLNEALTVDPNHREALAGLASLAQGRTAAEPWLTRLLVLEPDNPVLLRRLAQSAETRKDLPALEKYLTHAATLDLSDFTSRSRLAKIYTDRKDFAPAAPLLEQLITLWPYDRAVHEQALEAFTAVNDPARAERERRVLELLPVKTEKKEEP